MALAQLIVDLVVALGRFGPEARAVDPVKKARPRHPEAAQAMFGNAHPQVPVLVAAAQPPAADRLDRLATEECRVAHRVEVGDQPRVEGLLHPVATLTVADRAGVAPADGVVGPLYEGVGKAPDRAGDETVVGVERQDEGGFGRRDACHPRRREAAVLLMDHSLPGGFDFLEQRQSSEVGGAVIDDDDLARLLFGRALNRLSERLPIVEAGDDDGGPGGGGGGHGLDRRQPTTI